jgi:hypothetical protein
MRPRISDACSGGHHLPPTIHVRGHATHPRSLYHDNSADPASVKLANSNPLLRRSQAVFAVGSFHFRIRLTSPSRPQANAQLFRPPGHLPFRRYKSKPLDAPPYRRGESSPESGQAWWWELDELAAMLEECRTWPSAEFAAFFHEQWWRSFDGRQRPKPAWTRSPV